MKNLGKSVILILAFIFCIKSHAEGASMKFTVAGTGGNCNGCSWVAAEGEITAATPNEFYAFVNENPIAPAQPIVFNSPGGNLTAGLELGYRIRELGLITSVGKTSPDGFGNFTIDPDATCASACSWAFLGGVERDAKPSQIGVHQFYYSAALLNPNAKSFSANDLISNQKTMSQLISYAVAMGVDPRFVAKSSAVDPNNIYYLDDYSLDEYRVRWNPNLLKPWKIEAYKSGVVAYSKTNDEKTTAILFCDRKNRIKFQLKTPMVFNADWYASMFESLNQITLFGQALDTNSYSFTTDSGIFTLNLYFSYLDKNSFSPTNLNIGSNAAHAYYGVFEKFIISDRDLLINARIALNNCI